MVRDLQVCWLKDEGRGHQLTIVSGFEKLEKSRKQISPGDSKKQCNPANTLTIQPSETQVGLLSLQNFKIISLYCISLSFGNLLGQH